jgi:hypothetical protein
MASRAYRDAASAPVPTFFTESFQRRIAHWNHDRLAPQFPTADWASAIEREAQMLRLEGGFVEALRVLMISSPIPR